MIKKRILMVGVLLFLLAVPSLQGKNVFKQILGAYQKYQEINMTLWLVGDVGAEKRFGKELKFWLGLTHKEEKDPKINAYVKGIFNRLVPHFNNRGMKFDVRVIRNSTANAFVIPGGHVYVFTGLLDMVGSDDELAAVISHELAHAERRHSLKNFRASTAAVAILNKAVKNRKDRESWGALLGYLTMMQFSQKQEFEADEIGQFRMFKAGFNPAAQVTLWEKFLKKHGNTTGLAQYLSTHPPSSKRLEMARNNLKKMQVPEQKVFGNTRSILSAKKVNELKNHSFEIPLAANGIVPNWEISDGKAFISNKFAVTGQSSLQLDSLQRMKTTRVLSDFIPVGEKSDMHFSIWARSETGQQNLAIGVELYDSARRLRNRVWAIRESKPLPSDWTKIEGRLVNSSSVRLFQANIAFMRIVVQNGLVSAGSVWVDEALVRPSAAADPVNLIRHGDFEFKRADGSPDGIKPDNARLSLDYKVVNSGFSSLKIDNFSAGEAGIIFEPLPVSLLKNGQKYTCSYFFRGSQNIKGLFIVELLDEKNRPLARRIAQIEFEAAQEKWLANSFSFTFDLKPEEKDQAQNVQIKVVASIPALASLWMDTVVMR